MSCSHPGAILNWDHVGPPKLVELVLLLVLLVKVKAIRTELPSWMKLELKNLLTLDKCAALVAIIGFPLLLSR